MLADGKYFITTRRNRLYFHNQYIIMQLLSTAMRKKSFFKRCQPVIGLMWHYINILQFLKNQTGLWKNAFLADSTSFKTDSNQITSTKVILRFPYLLHFR